VLLYIEEQAKQLYCLQLDESVAKQ